MKATVFIEAECMLGESPMWHKERNSVWWVDIERNEFFECELETKHVNRWQVPQPVSLLVQSATNDYTLLLAVADGLISFNINENEFERRLFLEENISTNRSNDGGCDPNGRLWLGTMDVDCKAGAGKLYCIENDLQVKVKITSTDISNGLCWSLQQDKFYYIDSATYKVACYLFDKPTAAITFEKIAIEVPGNFGMPDGMAIDEEGMLWIAGWGGFSVNRWNPSNGQLLETIDIPAPNVTSCCFGGPQMNQLFITTARSGLNVAALEKYPLSGSVFIIPTAVKGSPKNKCSL